MTFTYKSVRWPGKLSPMKQDLVDKLCTAVPALSLGRDLVISFKDMMRHPAVKAAFSLE